MSLPCDTCVTFLRDSFDETGERERRVLNLAVIIGNAFNATDLQFTSIYAFTNSDRSARARFAPKREQTQCGLSTTIVYSESLNAPGLTSCNRSK